MSRPQQGARNTRAEIRRWVAGQRAGQAAEREVARQEGPQSARAVDLALSMIEAARIAGVAADPLRDREVALVRRTWRRLRRFGEPRCQEHEEPLS